METAIHISDDLKQFCEHLEFDSKLKDYKEQLFDGNKAENMLVLRNQFFYIYDLTTSSIAYVHPNVEEITGFSKSMFQGSGSIYELIHPDDREFVFELTKRTVSFAALYKTELFKIPFKSIFSIDFRVQHKSGHYIRLNRQACCFKTDHDGNMVLGFLLFTDITQSNKGESHNIHWIGDTKYLFHFNDLIKKYKKDYSITRREKDILTRLAEGESATKIAQRLSISVHTIISHRKSLLHKTGTKNTAELIKFAFEKALIPSTLSIYFLDALI
jgi:DNA-binding CsgD family transcriptional regulator